MGSLFGGVKPKEDIPILADKYLNKVSFSVRYEMVYHCHGCMIFLDFDPAVF